MAKLQAHKVDGYVARPPAHAVLLIYGPDTGLVSERAAQAAKSFGADPDDPFATIRLDADEAAADPQRIADEANTIAMFGGKRLVWVRGSTQRNLLRAVEPVLRTPPANALVLIEAGDLKPTGLRKAVENAQSAVALPCYRDERAALETVIDTEMREADLTIEREARDLLLSLLGGDRMASRGEVRKLALYAHGRDTVTADDVTAIVGDASAGAVDGLVDAVATGRARDAEGLLVQLTEAGTSPDAIAMALQRHFQMLHRARAAMDENGRGAEGVVGGLRPPVNFKRKPDVVRALQVWRGADLSHALKRLAQVAFLVRTQPGLAKAHLGTAIVSLTRMAAR